MSDIFDREEILGRISLPCELHIFDSIDSTNAYALEKGAGSVPLCVLADCQTAGRGRLGRSFVSPPGTGIYLTVARSMDPDPETAPLITMGTAVTACLAIEEVAGVSCGIKWVNDLYHRGRKVSGILTEARTVGGPSGLPRGSLLMAVGIGVNCFPRELPEEVRDIAGPVSDEPGSFSRNALAGALIDGILRLTADPDPSVFLPEYRKRCIVTGHEVILSTFDGRPSRRAEALEIADNGALVVRYLEGPEAGTLREVTSGEVSLRLAPTPSE